MEKQTPHKQNFRAKEAAEYLGIAISTVWLYAKQGRLSPIKLSPRITVFKKDDLDQLIAVA
jgi:predicted DNA-binding transcriptional regulator AlpA